MPGAVRCSTAPSIPGPKFSGERTSTLLAEGVGGERLAEQVQPRKLMSDTLNTSLPLIRVVLPSLWEALKMIVLPPPVIW